MSSIKTKTKIYLPIAMLVMAICFFSVSQQFTVPSLGGGNKANINIDNSSVPYEIYVYYYPSKKSAAEALAYYFSELNYKVQLFPASTVTALEASKYSPSHIFFNHDDILQAMGIKSSIEKVLGYPVNAYRFHVPQSSPSMMMVFTEYDQ